MSSHCPYCPPFDTTWGMSPEGYRQMQELHDAGHKISEEPELQLWLTDTRLQLATRDARTKMAEILVDGLMERLRLTDTCIKELREQNDEIAKVARDLLTTNTNLTAQLQAARDALAADEGEIK